MADVSATDDDIWHARLFKQQNNNCLSYFSNKLCDVKQETLIKLFVRACSITYHKFIIIHIDTKIKSEE